MSFYFAFDQVAAWWKIVDHSSGTYPPSLIRHEPYCGLVSQAGNLSYVGTCVSDLTIDPTTVPPSTNCYFTVYKTGGDPADLFRWRVNGTLQSGLTTFQEAIQTPSSNFTLTIESLNGYRVETSDITVSAQGICPQRESSQ